MLCVEFERPGVAELATKKANAIAMLEQILECLKSAEATEVAKSSDKDVIGLCHEIAGQICHDIDIIKDLDW